MFSSSGAFLFLNVESKPLLIPFLEGQMRWKYYLGPPSMSHRIDLGYIPILYYYITILLYYFYTSILLYSYTILQIFCGFFKILLFFVFKMLVLLKVLVILFNFLWKWKISCFAYSSSASILLMIFCFFYLATHVPI